MPNYLRGVLFWICIKLDSIATFHLVMLKDSRLFTIIENVSILVQLHRCFSLQINRYRGTKISNRLGRNQISTSQERNTFAACNAIRTGAQEFVALFDSVSILPYSRKMPKTYSQFPTELFVCSSNDITKQIQYYICYVCVLNSAAQVNTLDDINTILKFLY